MVPLEDLSEVPSVVLLEVQWGDHLRLTDHGKVQDARMTASDKLADSGCKGDTCADSLPPILWRIANENALRLETLCVGHSTIGETFTIIEQTFLGLIS